jgi:hypothetical protein
VVIKRIDSGLLDCAEPDVQKHDFNDVVRALGRSHLGSPMHDRPLLSSALIVLSLFDRRNTTAVNARGF